MTIRPEYIDYRKKPLGIFTSSTAVANYMIQKAIDEKIEFTNISLQKIAYIMYGFYLSVFDGKRLFFDKIEAWQYGTVIPSIYHTFKHCGKNKITDLANVYSDSFDRVIDGVISNEYTPIIPSDDGEQEKKVLDFVWEKYKTYAPSALVTLTHQDGTPWQVTVDDLCRKKPLLVSKSDYIMSNRPKIRDGLIKLYYDRFIDMNNIQDQFR